MNIDRFQGARPAKALFWAAALFALVMALLPHPPEVPGEPSTRSSTSPPSRRWPCSASLRFPRVSTPRLIVGLSLVSARSSKSLQAIPVLHRDSDPLDWLADTSRARLVLLALRWWRSRRR